MLKDLILKNRSYRRFYQDVHISRDDLVDMIDHARLSNSGANNQPLKYIISNEKEKNDLIFPTLSWAGYIKDWQGPEEGERPSAYIIMLGDNNISKNYWADPGIAIQSIMLSATEKGFGGCIIAAVDKDKLRSSLNISDRFEILYVLALGKTKEKVKLEQIGPDGDIKYYRDENEVHHVPKRTLDEIIIE